MPPRPRGLPDPQESGVPQSATEAHNASMPSGLLAERVRRDVEVVAHAGLDLDNFLSEALLSIQRAVPFVGACFGTVDPATRLLTGTRKSGDLAGRDERDHEWGLLEYGASEATTFTRMADVGERAAGVHLSTAGHTDESTRLREIIRPAFGYGDEARALCLDQGHLWGAAALFRSTDERPFQAEEVEFLASLALFMGAGVRGGLLASLSASAPGDSPVGPGVMIVDEADAIVQVNPGADRWLHELALGGTGTSPDGVISSLVGAARRFSRGDWPSPPRARIRTATGLWLVLHATPLSARNGAVGEVVVTIEEARPPEVVPLVVAAFGLTNRERDVVSLILQGMDTKEMGLHLHLSTWTVQDHLKSIFEKASVRSRRELIARVYFDQYVPRLSTGVGPSGWFTA
ncbi:DNA-binding transcriptional regulator, CsgD family [Tessaracoccus bendigoensis DSM 12906]|uniref:DNA-binding transcriptional regulator, CsgD family n=2 Tax=Tessaracoccus TaxID=72763 RepID=A0A1M6MBL7_9ACTN|nr:DNA-binding transcriptional regulator, CsgD family [Tessaracoccus bendigoensis DSM 12906]